MEVKPVQKSPLTPRKCIECRIHEISVLNPEHLECVSEESVQVEIIPPPQALSLSEEMTCLEEGSREITVTGEGF